MSEKEIIFNIKNAIEEAKKKYNDTYDVSMTLYSNKLIEGLLDLYNKEKEINADLVKTRIEDFKELNRIQQEDFIRKDKIKAKIKALEELLNERKNKKTKKNLEIKIITLKELLEEE